MQAPARLLSTGLAILFVFAGTPVPAADQALAPLVTPGTITIDAGGTARALVQPEFRDAPALREQLLGLTVEKLVVHLVTPRVPLPRPKPEAKLPAPVLSRLLLVGPEAAVRSGLSILRRLDRPTRSVRVCITVAEVWGQKYAERGGSFLFDRVNAPDQTNTMFRSLRIGFEPSEYVRSEVIGLRPYEGNFFRLFSEDFYDNLFEVTLRELYKRGSASYVARPNLMLNESEVGSLVSVRQVPQMLVSGRGEGTRVTQRGEEIGLKMRITPVRIGTDAALMDLDVWFRIPELVESAGAPVGTLELRERRVQTRVLARDGQAMLLSGIRIRGSECDFLSPIPFLPPIDPLFQTAERGGRASEIWFVIRVQIREPKIAPDGPTHHSLFDVR